MIFVFWVFFASVVFLISKMNIPVIKIPINDHFYFLYNSDSTSDCTVVQILIRGGKKEDPEDKNGMACLTTRLSMDLQSGEDIQEMMTTGAISRWHTFGDFSLLTVQYLSKYNQSILKIAAKNFTSPIFSSLRIDTIKKTCQFLSEAEQDDPIKLMFLNHFRLFFGPSGYGGSIYGSAESMDRIRVSDVKDFHQNYFNPENMIISISTNLAETDIKPLIEIFGRKNPPAKKISFKNSPITKSSNKVFIKKDKSQTLISMAFLLPPISRENYARAFLLQSLLAKGMGSKLWPLRVVHKLTYSVHAELNYFKDNGILTLYFKTEPAKKDQAYKIFRAMIDELYIQSISADELAMSQAFSQTDYQKDCQFKSEKAFYPAFFELMGLGYDFYDLLPEQMNTVTQEQMNTFIKQVFDPGNSAEVIIGPEDTVSQAPINQSPTDSTK